jgi:hypothetical protein
MFVAVDAGCEPEWGMRPRPNNFSGSEARRKASQHHAHELNRSMNEEVFPSPKSPCVPNEPSRETATTATISQTAGSQTANGRSLRNDKMIEEAMHATNPIIVSLVYVA